MQNHQQLSQAEIQRDGEKQLYIKCIVLIVISYKILITLAFKKRHFCCFPGFNLGICSFRHGLSSLGDGVFDATVA